jgi:antitoxin (DNA-binding transcriptional repressor) of toxin-antitoxin stability system
MLGEMELRVSSQVAAASLDGLLDQVSSGTATEVIIERDGKPVGRLLPVAPGNISPARRLTADDIKAIAKLVETGRQLNDGWADAVEEAIRLGNQPVSLEDPWDR